MRVLALALAVSAAAFAQRQPLRMTAGEARRVESPIVSIVATRTEPPLRFPMIVRAEPGGVRLTVPPATPRGEYRIRVTGRTEDGRESTLSLAFTVDPVTVPVSAKTPVILMNGWQFACPDNPDSTVAASAGTFGQLASFLQSDGLPVVFFNNCLYGQDVAIEELAGQLGAYLASLAFSDGTPVTQVDVVAHSMGGLIARAYLAGLQNDGSPVPPLFPKIRKLIQLATPNFGSFRANLLPSTQTSEMLPGSAFLWNLATWNQHQDDLRGVDALAVIGNAGSELLAAQSDGLVSLSSASLGFTRSDQRTRIVPYCHVTPFFPINLLLTCSGQGIADVDGPAHLSAQIVRSFLADTGAWQSIGTPPSKDPFLSQLGGLYFAGAQAGGALITDFTQASFGSTTLSNGGASGTVFYNEFLNGTNMFQATSTSVHSFSCGPFTEPPGFYTALRCKLPPEIFSVTPLVTGTTAHVVPSGGPVTVSGKGFGQPCGSCAVVLNPGNISLEVTSWTDQAITAVLPATNGSARITVRPATGSDTINIVAAPPADSLLVTSITNAASSAPGPIAPGELLAIKGSGLGPAAGVSFSVNPATGMVDTALAGTRVFFGTIAAPVLYTSATQVNVVVPYEVAGQPQVALQVSYQGSSARITLAVAQAAPAAFTFDSTGSHQAAAANQDGSFNGPSSPAPKNSYLTIYFTGGGATDPAGVTGSVNTAALRSLGLPIHVTVGGQPATVTFAGAAPGFVDGVLQLNIQLGANTPSGPAQPLVITVGGVSSPSTATLAVQ